jgi:hypothetical protein
VRRLDFKALLKLYHAFLYVLIDECGQLEVLNESTISPVGQGSWKRFENVSSFFGIAFFTSGAEINTIYCWFYDN